MYFIIIVVCIPGDTFGIVSVIFVKNELILLAVGPNFV
jgi:hypothetical protein